MDGIDRVRTARLVGARPALRDADELLAVMGDERVARWLWPGELGGPRTLAQVRGILVRDIARWKASGFGPWTVRDAATGGAIGRIGLSATIVEGHDAVELTWMVAPDRWGEGLATEMARAAVGAAFGPLRLPEVVAFTLPDNAGSLAVMRHLGMEYVREIEHAGLPHVLYRLGAP